MKDERMTNKQAWAVTALMYYKKLPLNMRPKTKGEAWRFIHDNEEIYPKARNAYMAVCSDALDEDRHKRSHERYVANRSAQSNRTWAMLGTDEVREWMGDGMGFWSMYLDN